MISIRKWIRDIFGFSGNEINGFLILLPLMVVLLLSEPLYRTWAIRFKDREKIGGLDSLVALWASETMSGRENRDIQPKLFHFDPNVADVDTLVYLGFDRSTANRIAAYRRKGGVFRIKADILRIYGVDSSLYQQLYDFIVLPVKPEGKRPARPHHERVPSTDRATRAERKFDINTADTVLLKSVYGIGPVLAARIIKFRDRLGGFVRPEQLNEVYGLDSVTVMRLRKICFIRQDFVPRKININTASEDKLSVHPYINYRHARLLVSYRYQHGDFQDASDIKKLLSLAPEEVDRLLPYLSVNDD